MANKMKARVTRVSVRGSGLAAPKISAGVARELALNGEVVANVWYTTYGSQFGVAQVPHYYMPWEQPQDASESAYAVSWESLRLEAWWLPKVMARIGLGDTAIPFAHHHWKPYQPEAISREAAIFARVASLAGMSLSEVIACVADKIEIAETLTWLRDEILDYTKHNWCLALALERGVLTDEDHWAFPTINEGYKVVRRNGDHILLSHNERHEIVDLSWERSNPGRYYKRKPVLTPVDNTDEWNRLYG